MTFLDDVRRRLRDAKPYYDPPEGDLRRYDQNVNLLGPHPAAAHAPDAPRLHLYPSRDNRRLLEALARRHRLPCERFWVGNGSDDVLDLAMRIFARPGQRLATLAPSYSMYERLAGLNRLRFVPVPTDEAFQVDVDALLGADADMLLVCNPNNPTGVTSPSGTIERLASGFEGPLLVDEAYADFAEGDATPLLERHDNLIVIRTLSKAYALAGLRVGYAVAHPDVAELVRRLKRPFCVNRVSEAVAAEALADDAPVRAAVAVVRRERARLASGLRDLGFEPVPSGANFVLARSPTDPVRLQAELRNVGILVRRYPDEPRLAGFLRFTVGSQRDTDTLLSALAHAVRPEVTA